MTFEEWWFKNFGNLGKDPEVVAMKAYQYATERAAEIAENDCSKKSRAHGDGFCSCQIAQRIRGK